MKPRVAVIALRGGGPDAVMLVAAQPVSGALFHGLWRELQAWLAAGRLVGGRAVMDLELSARWGCLVTCTPEFSAWWSQREGRPDVAFFLTVAET